MLNAARIEAARGPLPSPGSTRSTPKSRNWRGPDDALQRLATECGEGSRDLPDPDRISVSEFMPSGLFRAEADPSQAKAAGQQSRLGSISRSRTGLGRVASHRWRYVVTGWKRSTGDSLIRSRWVESGALRWHWEKMTDEPDLQDGGLSVWVIGRQFPNASDYWDGIGLPCGRGWTHPERRLSAEARS
jgi:hypothetical protein